MAEEKYFIVHVNYITTDVHYVKAECFSEARDMVDYDYTHVDTEHDDYGEVCTDREITREEYEKVMSRKPSWVKAKEDDQPAATE